MTSPLFPRHFRRSGQHIGIRMPHAPGFSLMELLAVVAIIAVLAALAIPAAQSVIGRGASAKCMANMKSIGAAVASFTADNNGAFPRGGWGDSGGSWNPPLPAGSGASTGWLVDIWPYVGKSREVFECPAAPAISPTGETSWTRMPESTATDPRYPMHYGYNAQLNSNRDAIRNNGNSVDRIVAVSRPSKLPVLIDMVFQNNFYGGSAESFTPSASASNIGRAFAARHNGRGNVLWADGSVSSHTAEEWSKMPEELVPTGSPQVKRTKFCNGQF